MEAQEKVKNSYKISKELIQALIRFEGIRLNPYKCPAGLWTIGIGSRHDLKGNEVTEKTKPITLDEAVKLLNDSIIAIYIHLYDDCGDAFNHNQIEAFIELSYNIGYPTVLKSSLYKNAKRGNNITLEDFTKFCHYKKNGLFVESKQLKQRRIFDFNMYTSIVVRTV